MSVDYEFWKFWMAVANFIGTVILAAYIFVTSRSRVNTERIDKLEKHTDDRIDRLEQHVHQHIGDHDKRLERVEERNKHMPTHEDLKQVHEKINRVSDGVSAIDGRLSGMDKNLTMIQEFLMNEGKKR
ncbi:hypothetical protein [Thiomicrorhabdus cannonii]|uniref:hypothetical protein n=1 Tax=Thiomicrorhabdus cannonii TaxID=2748011 RepID=UPI0015B8F186|nr:hypothetical protein [Thiomicrorhabdus cannonii]